MSDTTVAPVRESSSELRQRIRAALDANPRAMTVMIARQLGVPEVEVIRTMAPDSATPLDAARWEELVRGFESLGNVHVIASNPSVTLECFGRFGNFSKWPDFFNVQTKSLDMHIRCSAIGSVFAVRKPGHMDGVPTLSFQFFNHDGHSAFKVFLTFGGKEPSPECEQEFSSLVRRFTPAQ
jgi:putative heme iron utilization protein